MNPERIYLIGYRGTGKSTVGPILAAKLGWTFYDADQVFEERERMTIRECFALHGEAGFREREAGGLRELSAKVKAVVATGGGIVLRPENRKLLSETGFAVWLESSPATILTRMAADPTTPDRRPDLAEGGLAEIERLLALRVPLYSEVARLRIPTDRSFPERDADAILEAWNGTR